MYIVYIIIKSIYIIHCTSKTKAGRLSVCSRGSCGWFIASDVPCMAHFLTHKEFETRSHALSWSFQNAFSEQVLILRLPPTYQSIWTIYILFECPRLIDYKHAELDLKSTFLGYCSMGTTSQRENTQLRIFPNRLFFQFICEFFACIEKYLSWTSS